MFLAAALWSCLLQELVGRRERISTAVTCLPFFIEFKCTFFNVYIFAMSFYQILWGVGLLSSLCCYTGSHLCILGCDLCL